MLLAQDTLRQDKINQNTEEGSRFEELVSQYEDPIRALVHATLEEYVTRSFNEFMGPRVGTLIQRTTDGEPVKDYRNGTRTVDQLIVDTLILNNFRVPRNRAGGFKPGLLEKTKRRAGKFTQLAKECFVNGMGVRRLRRAFEQAGMKISGLSKSTVSDVTKDLLKEYVRWINRPIRSDIEYLQLDGVYVTVRKSSARKQGTLMIIGITRSGEKEVLHFTQGSESEVNVDEVFQNLIRRGLKPDNVKMITLDGAKGPINSVATHFGKSKIQRCTIHKDRNILDYCPKNLKDEMKASLGRLWLQSSKLEAENYLSEFVSRYEAIAGKSVKSLLDDKDDLFRFFSFPESHRKTIKCTNLIERVIQEVRRRTKVMSTIDSEFGCYGIIMGVVREQNIRWAKKSHWKKS